MVKFQYRLFLDHYPLWSFRNEQGNERPGVGLPFFVTRHDRFESPQLNRDRLAHWLFDSGYSSHAFTSPNLLATEYGLVAPNESKPPEHLSARNQVFLNPSDRLNITSPGYGVKSVQSFMAKFWLFSNVPEFQDKPWPFHVPYLAVHNDRPQSLIGTGMLLRTGIKIEIHFDRINPSVSVWVPLPVKV